MADAVFNAARSGNSEEVRRMIANGADLGSIDGSDNTPLHLAADCGHVDVIKILLDAGADVSATRGAAREISTWDDEEGVDVVEMAPSNTPLHLAAQRGHAEAVSILLDAGADVSARGMRVDLDEENTGVAEYLIYKSTAVHLAAVNGNANVIKILLDAGAEVLAQDADDDTPLQLAVQHSHSKAVQVLLAAGADVNQLSYDRGGESPLYIAVGNRDPETVKILLDAGADTKLKNMFIFTPLILAVDRARPTVPGESPQTPEAAAQAILVIRALLEGGADPSGRGTMTPMGATPLHFAAMIGLEEVVAILLDAGADETRTTGGRTPIDDARRHPAIEALLRGAAAARTEAERARVAAAQARCVAFAMWGGEPQKPEP